MPKFISSLSTRSLLLGSALLLSAFALAAPPAEAVPAACKGTGGITTYYSDASRTTIVGNYFSGCNGGCNGSGQITQFYRFDHYICTD
jgi:hypothetical protein